MKHSPTLVMKSIGERKLVRVAEPPLPRGWSVVALLRWLLPAVVLALVATAAQAGGVLTTLHSFQIVTNGANPETALVLGSDGNFYGTTYNGGSNGGWGTVFRMNTNGVLSTLYSFTGGNDGANPLAQLAQGNDGFLYGTAEAGGIYDSGTVFKISTNGAFTSLYSFADGTDGAYPSASLVQGTDGFLYGLAGGTVSKIGTNGVFAPLHFFGGEGGFLQGAGLIQGSDGFLYGTTQYGGANNQGSVFKISTNGDLTSLYSFTGTNDGALPSGKLVQSSNGEFYGTTYSGGTNGGWGTVFKMSASGALTNLYSFTDGRDGANPSAGLVLGSDGDLYGTTSYGGTNGFGTIFKVNTNGALTSLYSFATMGGISKGKLSVLYNRPGLVQGSDSFFYGTTERGGTDGYGMVFKISAGGALLEVYSFAGGSGGANPQAMLAQGTDSDFYGTTYSGGTNDVGTVFKISASGMLIDLYSFTGGEDGANPASALVEGKDGNFYGTTAYGGAYGAGNVFQMNSDGELTNWYSFTGADDGSVPEAALVLGSEGEFYGTTSYGGAYGSGNVFELNPDGAETNLYSFTGGDDGDLPVARLVQGNDGYFYGTTSSGGRFGNGTVFKINGGGAFTSLYEFGEVINAFYGPEDGGYPQAGLVQGGDGYFYGTTAYGGTYDNGTVFKVGSQGGLTSLDSFTGVYGDGANATNDLVEGSDGFLYGTTSAGGTYGNGTIFKLSTNGTLTTLYSFSGINGDGANPAAGLALGSDGNFYGTTYNGGAGGNGTVFRFSEVSIPPPPVFLAMTLTNRTVTLTWSTEAGASYQLQSKSGIYSGTWTNLGGVLTASGGTLSVTDSVSNGPRRFYRVSLSP